MFVIRIAGGIVLVALVVALLLRMRSARPGRAPKVEVRPTLPPSPYQPSRGFRIISGDEPPATHQVELPRLDPHKEFVFNDPTVAGETTLAPPLRHDEKWALDRSMRRAPHPRVRRRRRLAWVVLVVVLAAALAAALVWGVHPHHPDKVHSGLVSVYALSPSSWMM